MHLGSVRSAGSGVASAGRTGLGDGWAERPVPALSGDSGPSFPERCVPALRRGLLHRAPRRRPSRVRLRPAPRGLQAPGAREGNRARRPHGCRHLWGTRYAPLLPALGRATGLQAWRAFLETSLAHTSMLSSPESKGCRQAGGHHRSLCLPKGPCAWGLCCQACPCPGLLPLRCLPSSLAEALLVPP